MPVPSKNSTPAPTIVVTWLSKTDVNARRKPIFTAARSDLAGPQFFFEPLEDQHVRVDRHTDREHEAGDARQREHRVRRREQRQQREHVDDQRDVGQAGRAAGRRRAMNTSTRPRPTIDA